MPRPLPWIEPGAPVDAFPPVSRALRDPNGLLAVGGDLQPARLLAAYRRGIFPWYSDDQPILWWSPDPRTVLFPARLHRARSLARTLRRGHYQVRVDSAFDAVIAACAGPRAKADGTWITAEMEQAYRALHRLGHAHSIECWRDDSLVGGIYGLALGRVFCGESMFSRQADASKVAMVRLCELGFAVIDGQVQSPFLGQLGFEQIPRRRFVALLDELGAQPGPLDAASRA